MTNQFNSLLSTLYKSLFIFLLFITSTSAYANCIVDGTPYRTNSDTSGTYISISKLKSQASSWDNSTDSVTSCDVSQISSMAMAFQNNTTFDQDISAWNVSGVTLMKNMFRGATAFNNGGSGLTWSDTSAVKNMRYMFDGATSLTSVSFPKTSAVTNMRDMFDGATSLTSVDLPETGAVTNMKNMFLMASNFNQDIRFWDVDAVTNFDNMFDGATATIENYGSTDNWDVEAWFNDTIAPTMTITAAEVLDGNTSNDGTLFLTFTASEATTDFAVGDITVSNGALNNFAPSSSTVYTATFTPSASGAKTIDVAGGTFTDPSGNNNTAATQFNWTYDGTAPTMTITATGVSDGDTSNDATLSLTFTSSEATSDFVKADISVTGGSLGDLSGSGTTYTATFIPSDVECIYVNQEEQLGLGHAVLCAEKVVGNDPFCVILPDDYIHAKNNQTVSKLIKAFQKTGCCQLSVMPVDGPNICKYGVIKPGKRSNQVYRLIEKPSLKMAPSKIASIGRYVFTPSLFQSIKSIGVGHGGELQLADAIDQLAQNGNVEMVYLEGSRFDCGTERGYLNAILHLADRRKRPRIETYENMAPIQKSSECDEAFNIIDERFN